MSRDIAKCEGTNKWGQELSIAVGVEKLSQCPLRNKCKRFSELRPFLVSYRLIGVPYNKKTKKCKFFITKEKR
jgi:hypothetical protein